MDLRRPPLRRPPVPRRDFRRAGPARREPPHVPRVRLAGGQGHGEPLPRRVLMATLGLVNIGAIATGILASPRLEAEAILVERGAISAIGGASKTGAAAADVVLELR